MSLDFLMDWGLIWLFLGQLLLILWNERALGRPVPRLWGRNAPLVSLLVPARNEEGTIGNCLRSLLGQDYPNLEVLVLDDGSSDGTVSEVRRVAGSRGRVLTGAPLPPGWTGKNWACHQLSQAARGDLLLPIDADDVTV